MIKEPEAVEEVKQEDTEKIVEEPAEKEEPIKEEEKEQKQAKKEKPAKEKTEKKTDEVKGSKRQKTMQCKVTLLDDAQFECELDVSKPSQNAPLLRLLFCDDKQNWRVSLAVCPMSAFLFPI